MVVHVYNDIQLMTGTGEEWLVSADAWVIAIFVNGRLKSSLPLADVRDVTKH